MKKPRFIKWRWNCKQFNPVGFVLIVLAIVLVPVFVSSIQPGSYISHDLCGMFVYTTSAACWWMWVADKTYK